MKMSYHSDLDLIRQEMEALDQPEDVSAEVQIERKVDSIIRDLDELCALASNSETVDLVEAQVLALGQLHKRAQLVLALIAARQTPRLKLVKNDFFRPENYAHA